MPANESPTPRRACPVCCDGAPPDGSACPWIDDMLRMFGGLLFVGVSRQQLALLAPCRRARRGTAAVLALADDASGAPQPRRRHLRLVDSA